MTQLEKMKKITVIIPAYKPDEKLLATLRELQEAGFGHILVVNDGSGEAFEGIFAQVEQMPACHLIRHEVNRGKGAALKTAFAHVMAEKNGTECVVTADADGQHLVKDIIAVADTCLETGHITLGCRDFTDPKVPARSKAGNQTTCVVFRLFFGMKIQDTQTGLRAFPMDTLPVMCEAAGDRYEYETNMLFLMNRKDMPFEQVKIETVYIEENKSSHFRVVRDSIRIYALILKYLFSSAASAVVDETAFFLFKVLFAGAAWVAIPVTFVASFLARAVSSLTNYYINSKVVFGDKPNKKTLVRYYCLVIFQICLSATLVFVIEKVLRIQSPGLSTLVKTLVDMVLFLISFRIQHKWVFNDKEK